MEFLDSTKEDCSMLPSILAKQLQKGIGDYIETTFPMTNEPFKGSVEKMLANKGSVYHERSMKKSGIEL